MTHIFISGGAKTSKSTLAVNLARRLRKPDTPLYYVATMAATDSEDEARIRRHRAERTGLGFTTVEAATDILRQTAGLDPAGTYLLDSLTALLANEMFQRDGSIRPDSPRQVAQDLSQLLEAVENIIFVSDYIYSDAAIYDELTEAYRKGLAFIDRQLAERCDCVVETCAGNRIIHKGASILDTLTAEEGPLICS
ncbi:MAG: bifunctional adenosylcobinamide kinase/adenosylcobinamide-phosphate guanylyltransferase [Coriobacteriia bacterium]|nr:bifunctional adenosylcobinamide kinase/adenosylcobinamide-phosphate guanylyltransferase [Coriobacteriia bacterium]